MPISIVDRATGTEIAVLNIPPFCLEHMRGMTPEANMKMLVQYTRNEKISSLTFKGKNGITPEDLAGDCVLEATL